MSSCQPEKFRNIFIQWNGTTCYLTIRCGYQGWLWTIPEFCLLQKLDETSQLQRIPYHAWIGWLLNMVIPCHSIILYSSPHIQVKIHFGVKQPLSYADNLNVHGCKVTSSTKRSLRSVPALNEHVMCTFPVKELIPAKTSHFFLAKTRRWKANNILKKLFSTINL